MSTLAPRRLPDVTRAIARSRLALPALALASAAFAPAAAPTTPLAGAPVRAVVVRQVQREVTGTVFDDTNDNGRRDPGEGGVAGAVVSDQDSVVRTDADGRYRIASGFRNGVVFVSIPSGYRARGQFWAPVEGGSGAIDFALRRMPPKARLTLLHASDTHVAPPSVPRMVRLRALVDSLKPDVVIISGDLVRDALRVGEAEARGYYDLFQQQVGMMPVAPYTIPGNHENFGIERDRSKVTNDHPLYGRAMYHHYRGPDYYSFNLGGIHFVGLNSVDIDDTHYYGHVDSLQLAWLARDLAAVPAATPVVTFNHIPFFTAVETINGLQDGPPAPSVIVVNGKGSFRHAVSNAREVITAIAPHPYPLALAGHMHTRESLRYEGVATRFDNAAAIVAPSGGPAMQFPSGVSLYTITNRTIGDARFVPLGIDSQKAH